MYMHKICAEIDKKKRRDGRGTSVYAQYGEIHNMSEAAMVALAAVRMYTLVCMRMCL